MTFQRKVDGVWRHVASRTVPSNGVARATVRMRAAKYYRAVVWATATAGAATARTIRK